MPPYGFDGFILFEVKICYQPGTWFLKRKRRLKTIPEATELLSKPMQGETATTVKFCSPF
ncbi:hypothetical protein DC20_13475 [Rufibacter tibetensis]|uniref:Uncharacterized protein n=1 Tax=Rufibacter tibetensis TaxID=512763 RepID=A0A0N7HWP2_9BACT|nr:hypothetical protein DC20_13475 [Rufibacter tibetensis]